MPGEGRGDFYIKRKLNANLSGNEVYYTKSLMLLVKNMLRCSLHYPKVFNSILFHINLRTSAAGRGPALGDTPACHVQGYLAHKKQPPPLGPP